MLDEWDPRRGRTGRPWRRLVAAVCPPGSVCALCGHPIVFGLRRNHPRGPSVDHITPLSEGGHPTASWNLRPAHFGCNAGRRRRRELRLTASRAVLPVGTSVPLHGRASRARLEVSQ